MTLSATTNITCNNQPKISVQYKAHAETSPCSRKLARSETIKRRLATELFSQSKTTKSVKENCTPKAPTICQKYLLVIRQLKDPRVAHLRVTKLTTERGQTTQKATSINQLAERMSSITFSSKTTRDNPPLSISSLHHSSTRFNRPSKGLRFYNLRT